MTDDIVKFFNPYSSTICILLEDYKISTIVPGANYNNIGEENLMGRIELTEQKSIK